MRVEPRGWPYHKGERRVWKRECPRRGIVLVHSDSRSARLVEVIIEIAVASRALDQIQHAIGHGLCGAVERSVNVHRCWPCWVRRCRDACLCAQRERALVVVLMA